MSETKIEQRYNPEFDMRPDGPPVTWAEYELQQQILVLNTKMSQLQNRIEELEQKEKEDQNGTEE